MPFRQSIQQPSSSRPIGKICARFCIIRQAALTVKPRWLARSVVVSRWWSTNMYLMVSAARCCAVSSCGKSTPLPPCPRFYASRITRTVAPFVLPRLSTKYPLLCSRLVSIATRRVGTQCTGSAHNLGELHACGCICCSIRAVCHSP